jgi:hypothetical protein
MASKEAQNGTTKKSKNTKVEGMEVSHLPCWLSTLDP